MDSSSLAIVNDLTFLDLPASNMSSTLSFQTFLALIVFGLLFGLKSARLIVHSVAFLVNRPIQPSLNPRLGSTDVSVILPTVMNNLDELRLTVFSIVMNRPRRIVLVVSQSKVDQAKKFVVEHSCCQFVDVIGVPKLGKRRQMVAGIKHVREHYKSEICVFSDDDVIWSSNFLTWIVAPFENDHKVGAVGPSQTLVRPNRHMTVTDFLGLAYLERRVFLTAATNTIDGAISTLSGRTSAVRSSILNAEFFEFFLNEHYRGRHVTEGDDKSLTRYLFSHGWQIKLQITPECALQTTLDPGRDFYTGQCVRWERAKWRGNSVVMDTEIYWYKQHPWTCFSVYLWNYTSPSMIFDGLLYTLLRYVVAGRSDSSNILWAFVIYHCVFMKVVKLIPHWTRHPQDLRFLPHAVGFSYLHGFLSLYARATLENSNWGNRVIEN